MPFKPAKDLHTKNKAAYENKPEGVHKKKNYRDEDGAVIIGPRNFTAIPMRRGKVGKLTTFGGPIPHMADNYDAKKELTKKERERHASLVQEKPFSQQCRRLKWGTFNRPYDVFGEGEAPIPPRPAKSAAALPELHDRAFRPCGPKKGVQKTLMKFPEYIPEPPHEVKRKVKDETEEERPGFRPTYNKRSIPCKSVATNYRNLKASFPMHFRTGR